MDNEYYVKVGMSLAMRFPRCFLFKIRETWRYKVFESLNQLLKVDNPENFIITSKVITPWMFLLLS